MPLDNLDGADTLDIIETKIDAAIDELNNNQIKWTVVEIGDWDMDTNGSISIAHGIADYTKIRSISVMIRNDSIDALIPLGIVNTSGVVQGGVNPNVGINSTHIGLLRVASGSFDSVGFDSTSFNRGFITIGYVE